MKPPSIFCVLHDILTLHQSSHIFDATLSSVFQSLILLECKILKLIKKATTSSHPTQNRRTEGAHGRSISFTPDPFTFRSHQKSSFIGVTDIGPASNICNLNPSMLEVACFSVESAIIAAENGASRIELCENQEAGGTTPPQEWLTQVKARVSVPVFVMIRPRGGDFEYSDLEFANMQAELEAFRPQADGFVFGILDHDKKVDKTRTAELVRLAHPLPCTFHRAFDVTQDPFAALEDVISSGCKAILSSGGRASALEGMEVLSELVKESRGRITIIPGGGVRASNFARIRSITGATVMHSSCLPSTACPKSDAGLPDVGEVKEMVRIMETLLPQP